MADNPVRQDYAAFLLAHHVEDVALTYLKRCSEPDIPMMKKFLAAMPADQLRQMTTDGWPRSSRSWAPTAGWSGLVLNQPAPGRPT